MLKVTPTFRFLLPLTRHPLRVTLSPPTCSLCISISCSSTLMVSCSSPITDSLQADTITTYHPYQHIAVHRLTASRHDYNLSPISTHCSTQTHCKQTRLQLITHINTLQYTDSLQADTITTYHPYQHIAVHRLTASRHDYNLSPISTHCSTQTHCKQTRLQLITHINTLQYTDSLQADTITTYHPYQHIAVHRLTASRHDYNLSPISTHCSTQTHCKQTRLQLITHINTLQYTDSLQADTITTYHPYQHIAVHRLTASRHDYNLSPISTHCSTQTHCKQTRLQLLNHINTLQYTDSLQADTITTYHPYQHIAVHRLTASRHDYNLSPISTHCSTQTHCKQTRLQLITHINTLQYTDSLQADTITTYHPYQHIAVHRLTASRHDYNLSPISTHCSTQTHCKQTRLQLITHINTLQYTDSLQADTITTYHPYQHIAVHRLTASRHDYNLSPISTHCSTQTHCKQTRLQLITHVNTLQYTDSLQADTITTYHPYQHIAVHRLTASRHDYNLSPISTHCSTQTHCKQTRLQLITHINTLQYTDSLQADTITTSQPYQHIAVHRLTASRHDYNLSPISTHCSTQTHCKQTRLQLITHINTLQYTDSLQADTITTYHPYQHIAVHRLTASRHDYNLSPISTHCSTQTHCKQTRLQLITHINTLQYTDSLQADTITTYHPYQHIAVHRLTASRHDYNLSPISTHCSTQTHCKQTRLQLITHINTLQYTDSLQADTITTYHPYQHIAVHRLTASRHDYNLSPISTHCSTQTHCKQTRLQLITHINTLQYTDSLQADTITTYHPYQHIAVHRLTASRHDYNLSPMSTQCSTQTHCKQTRLQLITHINTLQYTDSLQADTITTYHPYQHIAVHRLTASRHDYNFSTMSTHCCTSQHNLLLFHYKANFHWKAGSPGFISEFVHKYANAAAQTGTAPYMSL